MKGLKIKVCGMLEPANIRDVSALLPDYLGFIFYDGSERYAGKLSQEIRAEIPAFVKKVGVFVDEKRNRVIETCNRFGIGTVQLHGEESPDYCEKLAESGLRIIKAFHIGRSLDPRIMLSCRDSCSYYLFDTETKSYGGSGLQFDWGLLKGYTIEIPFFLSGGIGTDDAERIRSMAHPMLFGVDINSRFETSPGVKNVAACEDFIRALRAPR